MANILTNPGILALDTLDIISLGAIYIRALEFVPNAAGDLFVLSSYDLNAPLLRRQIAAGTITGNATLTGAGTDLPSSFAAGDIFELLGSHSTNLEANNKKALITTAGNNTVVVCAQAGWTNEANKVYTAQRYAQYVAYSLKSQATTLKGEGRNFGNPGLRFDNLALTALSNSAKLYLYV
jgi:hypothetical protein